MCKLGSIAAVALVCGVGVAQAADYTVPTDGTLDAVIGKAVAGDVIYVTPGTYETTTQYGPNLKAKLIGTGASRDDVVIQSSGSYRTLRLADGGCIEKVTIIGEGSYKADKGGAVEVNGGTITNCVITGGTAYGNDSKNAGGNLYVNANGALIVDCVISGGSTKNRGGNICIDHGTVRDCTITDGSIPEKKDSNAEQFGGNVFMYQGNLENCTVTGGSAERGGNVYVHNSISLVKDCTIENGSTQNYGGNVFLRDGKLTDCDVTGGTCSGGSNPNGGNLYQQNGTVSGCTFKDATAMEGGSIYMTGGTITGSTVYANGTTSGSGGGIYLNGSGCVVDDSTIDGTGGSMNWHGGCIYMKSGTVRNTVCRNGTCTKSSNREGGNVFMENGTLENVTLENGTCAEQGGNLFVSGGVVKGLICRGGTAGSNGGNIRAKGAVTISDAQIADGTIITDAEAKGCNVYMDDSVKLIRAKVTGGTSWKADKTTPGYNGGSVCTYGASTLIDTCLVAGCARGGILSGTQGHFFSTTIVANEAYGFWAWNQSQAFENCVLFGNVATTEEGVVPREYWGNQPAGDNGKFVNCAMSAAGALSQTTYSTLVVMNGESDFVDYASGDYRPSQDSALTDAGAADTRTEASVKDLAGMPRLSEGIDIGCYEYQHSNMTVAFTAPALDHAYTPATASFTATAENVPSELVFVVDFGDGTEQNFTDGAITHTYTTAGTFTITVKAKSGEEVSKPMTREVRIVDKVQRVGEGGHATIQEAIAASEAGCEIVVSAGAYEVTEPIVLNKAVTMTGDGAVVIRNVATASASAKNCRVLTVGNGAVVKGFVIENGQVYNDNGGCVSIDTGTLEDCIIRGGLATANGGNASGAGVFISGAATLRRCTVTGNTVNGTSSGSGDICGGAVFVKNGAKPKILNTLVADNVYISTDATRTGAAGVMYGGSNENALMENCTVAGNLVQGSLKQASAGCYCTSWSAIFRNNVFAANRETGREGASAVNIDSHNTVTYCITDTAEAVNANCFTATVEAMFRNVAGRNYRPKTQGALWNKGTTPSVTETTDLLGNPRIMFDVIDLGCYELQHKLSFTVSIR